VVNLIPDRTVEAIIDQLRPERAHVVHSSVSSFLKAFCAESLTRRALLDLLADVCRYCRGQGDPRDLVTRLLRAAQEIWGFQGAGVWVKRGEAFALFGERDLPDSLRAFGPARGEGGVFDRLLEERAPLWIKDVESEPSLPERSVYLQSGFKSATMVPVLHESDVLGVLCLFRTRPSSSDRGSLRFLQAVADALALVLAREGEGQEARDQPLRDETTGLYNGVYFMDRLRAEMGRASRGESPLSLLYLTVTPREAGGGQPASMDSCLRAVAGDVLASVRNVDVPARYRKNDLVVILPETTAAGAMSIAGRLLERLSTTVAEGSEQFGVKISMGVASYPEHAAEPKALLTDAELAAFLANREGGRQIQIFPSGPTGLEGLTPEGIVREYPELAEVFHVLDAQGAKDRHTFVHARDVARSVSLMARELGLPVGTIRELGIAAWLHDVGKMTLPGANGEMRDKLLRLPALNMKIHPTVGAFILKNLVRSPAILRGILHHHARFDGAGQPAGLRGEAIPLEARIIAVADAYQHLQADLDKGQGATQRDLFHALRRKAGRELDPQLVECLIRAVVGL
jgi:diguanylate cyclase (GGDEF)-like protein